MKIYWLGPFGWKNRKEGWQIGLAQVGMEGKNVDASTEEIGVEQGNFT